MREFIDTPTVTRLKEEDGVINAEIVDMDLDVCRAEFMNDETVKIYAGSMDWITLGPRHLRLLIRRIKKAQAMYEQMPDNPSIEP